MLSIFILETLVRLLKDMHIFVYICKRHWQIIFPVLERHGCKHIFCPLHKDLHVAVLKRKGRLLSLNFVLLRRMHIKY